MTEMGGGDDKNENAELDSEDLSSCSGKRNTLPHVICAQVTRMCPLVQGMGGSGPGIPLLSKLSSYFHRGPESTVAYCGFAHHLIGIHNRKVIPTPS